MSFEQPIIMTPNLLGPELQSLIRAKLIDKVQGMVTEKFGYVICVLRVEDIGSGKILDTTADVIFSVKYRAVVMKPFIGEVMDGFVIKLDKYGVHVSVGPIIVFISNQNFPFYEYDENNNHYYSKHDAAKIMLDSNVRFKITGITFEDNEFRLIGTMNEDYLGVLQ